MIADSVARFQNMHEHAKMKVLLVLEFSSACKSKLMKAQLALELLGLDEVKDDFQELLLCVKQKAQTIWMSCFYLPYLEGTHLENLFMAQVGTYVLTWDVKICNFIVSYCFRLKASKL